MLDFREEFVATLAITVVATVGLLFTEPYSDFEFRDLFLRVFAVTFGIQLFWDIIIYPLFVSPLRHLPRVKVSNLASLAHLSSYKLMTRRPYDANLNFRAFLLTQRLSSILPVVAFRCIGSRRFPMMASSTSAIHSIAAI